MTSPPVTYAVSNRVAVITLSRPQARNAIDSTLAAGLIDAFTRAASPPRSARLSSRAPTRPSARALTSRSSPACSGRPPGRRRPS